MVKQLKILLLVITIISLILSTVTGGMDNSEHIKEINMTFSSPQIIKDGEYLQVSLKEATSYLCNPHQPRLPVWSIPVYFPFGTTIDDVELRHAGTKEIEIYQRVQPSPAPLPLGHHGGVSRVQTDKSIYNSSSPYPLQWYTLQTGGGIKDGKRVTSLTIHLTPTRYLPDINILEFIDDISLKIKYHPPKISQITEGPKLVIITPLYYSLKFIPLMQHKNTLGLPTAIVTLDEIYNGDHFPVQGRDDQEKIKYFIKQAIENWDTQYILLGGSAQDIPVRQAYISSIMPPETSFPSDLYYADIYDSSGDFSSWDSNSNNLFGEYHYEKRTDDVDLYPDVYLGRLACENLNQISSVVEKIIQYEENTHGKEWFKNIVVCGGDTFPGDIEMINEGEYVTGEVVDIMSDFSHEKLWASTGTLNKKDIIKKINEGAGFIDFSGHGSDIKWKTYLPNTLDEQIEFDMYDVSFLTNREKLPIITINACSCGQFDQGTCIAWQFVKIPFGGAIATIAASGIAYGIEGSSQTERYMGWMETHFYEYYQNMGNTPTHLGNIWSKTITEYLNHFTPSDADYKTVEEWTLFGDPSLIIGGYQNINETSLCKLNKPLAGYLYSNNQELRPTFHGQTIILGGITLTVTASSEINKVEFYVDDTLKYTDYHPPFAWEWDEQSFLLYKLTIIGYTDNGETHSDSVDVRIINFNVIP